MVAAVITAQRRSTSIVTTRSIANGAARLPTALAATTAQLASTRSEGGEPIFSHDVNCKLYLGLDDLNRKRRMWI